MPQIGPVRDVGSFNDAIEEVVNEAQVNGMDDALIIELLEQEVAALASQLMRERQGLEFGVAKAIRSNAKVAQGLAGRLD